MPNKDELLAEAKDKNVEVSDGATKAEIQAALDEHAADTDSADSDDRDLAEERSNVPENAPTTDEANAANDAADRITPPVAANPLSGEASDEAYEANNQVNPSANAVEVKDSENERNVSKEETRKAEATEVETDLGSSEEEAAAYRAGVPDERLEDPKQNREPKNQFEQSNQKVTEEERVAAQKVSNMSTQDRVENASEPKEAAQNDAARTAGTNQNSDIAQAIAEGFKNSKDDSFKLTEDAGVDARFTLVKNGEGEVMVRENETGHLSRIQLLSIEEKEASIQNQEVTEL